MSIFYCDPGGDMAKRWALVLSGGGAKGLAHVGVLEALEELGYRPSLVVGTSMGAIVGGLYATGMGPARMRDFLEDFDIRDYLTGFSFQLPENLPFIRILQAGEALGNLLKDTGMEPGTKIYELLRDLTQDLSFEDLALPFRCNAVDLISGIQQVFSEGRLADAIRASMSFPGVFRPWKIGEGLYVDGGIVDNMPVWIARMMGYSPVIAVNVAPKTPVKEVHIQNGIDVIMRSFSLVASRIPRHYQNVPDLEIVASDGTSPFDFSRKDVLIRLGKDLTLAHRDRIKALVRPGLSRLIHLPDRLISYMRRKRWVPDWRR